MAQDFPKSQGGTQPPQGQTHGLSARAARRLTAWAEAEVSGPKGAEQVAFTVRVSRAFLVFCVIGALNTLIHAGLLAALVEGAKRACSLDGDVLKLWTVGFNGAAFLAANVFSYFANSRWSFRAGTAVGRYLKFAVTSLAGLLLSLAIMHVGVEVLGWYYLAVFIPQTVLMCIVNFTLLRLLVFKLEKHAAAVENAAAAADNNAPAAAVPPAEKNDGTPRV